MNNPGTKATKSTEDKLEAALQKVYGKAAKEIRKQLDALIAEHGPEMKKLEMDFINGTISEQDLKWLQAKTLQKKILAGKVDQLTGTLLEANQKAIGMVNGEQVSVFAENANYQAYQITQDAGMNLQFAVYDENTAEKLLKDKPELLPRKEVNGKKDKAWNRTKIANATLQAVVQGESIPKLARRIANDVAGTNMNAMVRYARTAMTSAQNAGRMETMHRAQGMGIKCKKQWLAALDSRTRDSHQEMDGVTVGIDEKFPNGLMFPGDPSGPPAEVYNCRCTLVYVYEDFPADPTQDMRLDNESGQEIIDMSYKEWKTAKEGSQLNALNYAKTQLAEAQKAVVKFPADKVYSGIWKDDVTLADYPAKKGTIQAKRDYYDTEIQKYKDAQANGSAWATDDKIKDLEKKRKQLNEFEKRGELIEKRDQALQAVQAIYNQIGYGKQITAPAAPKPVKAAPKNVAQQATNPDAYSKERKNKALWTTDRKKVDSMMRARTGEVWRNATDAEKDAIYEYTQSFSKFNEPLRGIEYGTNKYLGVGNTDLNAKGNGKRLDAMTDIIDKCWYDHDMWLQRGCGWTGMDKFLQIPEDTLRYGTQAQLENALLGKTVTEYGFMSMGSAKGKGFSGSILLNIYAPAGTKMMYAEPFSAYGGGHAYKNWDGTSGQSSFGSEFETIMQQGTQFRIAKVEKTNGKLYLDIEVINQDNQQRWKK